MILRNVTSCVKEVKRNKFANYGYENMKTVKSNLEDFSEHFCQLTCLLHYKDGVVHLLALENRVQVVKKNSQVVNTVSVGYDKGDLVACSTVFRLVVTPGCQLRMRTFLFL